MSRLPHFLGNWLTGGGEVVSFMRRPRFILKEDSSYEAKYTPGPSAAGRVR
jgi:hypothetical protein